MYVCARLKCGVRTSKQRERKREKERDDNDTAIVVFRIVKRSFLQ